MARSFIRCALRLKIRYLGVAQLVARYLGVTMTARSIVDQLRPPTPTNDVGTNESARLKIISQSGMPNGEIVTATQPTALCYATCYAMRLMNAFLSHFCYIKSC